MAFEDTQQQTASLGDLSAMPQDPGAGGPGIDTPQEQQAVELLMQAAQGFRQAAETDPSVKPIIDAILQDAFLKITTHYGFGEEGKMALKQAQMGQEKARSSALSYGGPPTQGSPLDSAQGGPDLSPPPSPQLNY